MTERDLHPLVRRGLFAIVLLTAQVAGADCATDMRGDVFCGAGRCLVDTGGTVWCSRYDRGDASRTLDGQVVCGIGQCAKTLRGEVFCSSEIGGAALLDNRGRVRCYGRCEPATADLCENTRAAGAD